MNYVLRYSIFFVMDSLIVLTAILASHWLLKPVYLDDIDTVILISLISLTLSHQVVAYFFQLYDRIWSVASIRELLVLSCASLVSILFASFTQLLVQSEIYFRLMVVTWTMYIMLIGGSRLVLRLLHEKSLFRSSSNLRRVLVIGAGEAGTIIIRSIKRNPTSEYKVVALVDDDLSKQKLKLLGIKVCGTTKDVTRIVESKRVDEILIAIPSLGKKDIQDIYKRCVNTKIPIKIMPKIEDVMTGKITVNDLREVKIEDLLGRQEVKLDLPVILNKLESKTILVTGAGGSIGSEICRQVLLFRPSKILLLGHGENSIYTIYTELTENTENHATEIIPIIADIQDRKRIFEVVNEYQPDVIYHAAAHKHVPLMEFNASEAVKNNIFGTRNIAEAAHAFGVSNFVMVSTDKAVKPPNVMGASKRVAEMVIQNLAKYSETNFAAVRFGNVLGSRGSVIPRFQAQIAAGGPITVTHPEMTRYFMTIPEAARLVLQAGALARGGEVFVLDMGEPMKILDLAKNLIRLSGFTEEEIAIEFSGIRPGEKMFEELLNQEEIQEEHVYPKIHVGKANCPDENLLLTFLTEMEKMNTLELKELVIEMANSKWDELELLMPKTIA